MGRPALPEPEALEHRLDHLVEGQPAVDVQLGREAHLGVDDAVVGQVLGALGGHPHEGVLGLHDADRVLERLEVEVEVVPVGARVNHWRQLVDVGRGQRCGRRRVRARPPWTGRSPPSRWSCSSTLGARRIWSRVGAAMPQATGRPVRAVGTVAAVRRMVTADGGAGDADETLPRARTGRSVLAVARATAVALAVVAGLVGSGPAGAAPVSPATPRGPGAPVQAPPARGAPIVAPGPVAGWSTTVGTDGRVVHRRRPGASAAVPRVQREDARPRRRQRRAARRRRRPGPRPHAPRASTGTCSNRSRAPGTRRTSTPWWPPWTAPRPTASS